MVPEWTLSPETATEIEKSVTPLLNALECVGSMRPGPRRLGPVGLEGGISICWSLGSPAAFPPEPRLGERCMHALFLAPSHYLLGKRIDDNVNNVTCIQAALPTNLSAGNKSSPGPVIAL